MSVICQSQIKLNVQVSVNGGAKQYREFCAITCVLCMRCAGVKFPEAALLEVEFVGQRAIRKLNAKFRGKDCATDVLSFCGQKDVGWIGSVVLCLGEIKLRNPDIPTVQAVRKTLIHGVLHVLGYDHETDQEWKSMVEKEKEVYSRVSDLLRSKRGKI